MKSTSTFWSKPKVRAATAAVSVVGLLTLTGIPVSGAQANQTSCGTAPAGYNVIESNARTIRGTKGNDFICGGASANVIKGQSGNDIMYGGGGNDRLDGGKGNDVMHGDDGDDTLKGGKGSDKLDGGRGDDNLHGGRGDDTLKGGRGKDRVRPGSGDDKVEEEVEEETDEEVEETDEEVEETDEETEEETDEETGEETEEETGEDSGSTSDYFGDYVLDDAEFGTQVTVTVDGTTRTILTNALPDHETGEFPTAGNPNTISAQDLTYEYPATGTYVGSATTARTTGVAVNGVKFEPATAETVTCATGGTLRVEAIQDLYNLGLDFNNAHVQPTGEYHYHGLSELLANAYATDDDLVHVGFAADGFMMYYSKSGAYSSGYELSTGTRSGTDCVASSALGGGDVAIDGSTPDGTYASDWVFNASSGELDSCNGVFIDGEYAYMVTNEYPFISRCLNGEVAGEAGPPAGGGGGAAPGQ